MPLVACTEAKLDSRFLRGTIPSVSISAPGTVYEGASAVPVRVVLSEAPWETVTVNLGVTGSASSGTDYLFSGPSEISFAPGETEKNYPLSAVADGSSDPGEQVRFTISGPTNATLGTSEATVAISEAGQILNFGQMFNNGAALASFGAPYSAATFTRASTGSYVDADGYLKVAASGTPRFEHDSVTGQTKGLLLEAGATNLAPNSANFVTSWVLGNITTVANTTEVRDPMGGYTAEKYVLGPSATPTNYTFRTNISGSYAYQLITVSLFFKLGAGATHVRMRVRETNSSINGFFVDCKPYASYSELAQIYGNGLAEPVAAGIQKFRDGWVRCYGSGITSTVVPATSPSTAISVGGQFMGPTTIFATNPGDAAYMWGLQVEVGSAPSSYIATSGAAATRAADSFTISNPGNYFAGGIGSLLAEYSLNYLRYLPELRQNVLTIDDGSTNNKLELVGREVNTATGRARNDTFPDDLGKEMGQALTSARSTAAATLAGKLDLAVSSLSFDRQRLALSMGSGSGSMQMNGPSRAGPSALPLPGATLSRLGLGNATDSTQNLMGPVKRVEYLPTTLSSSTMSFLTDPQNGLSNQIPVVRLASSALATTEASAPVSFIVGLSQPYSGTVTVNYTITGTATAGADYAPASTTGTLTFAPGEERKRVEISPVVDGSVEAPETVILTISSPVNAILGAVTSSTLTLSD